MFTFLSSYRNRIDYGDNSINFFFHKYFPAAQRLVTQTCRFFCSVITHHMWFKSKHAVINTNKLKRNMMTDVNEVNTFFLHLCFSKASIANLHSIVTHIKRQSFCFIYKTSIQICGFLSTPAVQWIEQKIS